MRLNTACALNREQALTVGRRARKQFVTRLKGVMCKGLDDSELAGYGMIAERYRRNCRTKVRHSSPSPNRT